MIDGMPVTGLSILSKRILLAGAVTLEKYCVFCDQWRWEEWWGCQGILPKQCPCHTSTQVSELMSTLDSRSYNMEVSHRNWEKSLPIHKLVGALDHEFYFPIQWGMSSSQQTCFFQRSWYTTKQERSKSSVNHGWFIRDWHRATSDVGLVNQRGPEHVTRLTRR